jgi:hypothetical protein
MRQTTVCIHDMMIAMTVINLRMSSVSLNVVDAERPRAMDIHITNIVAVHLE